MLILLGVKCGYTYLVSFEVKGEEPHTYVEHDQSLLHQFYACASMAALSYSLAPAVI